MKLCLEDNYYAALIRQAKAEEEVDKIAKSTYANMNLV